MTVKVGQVWQQGSDSVYVIAGVDGSNCCLENRIGEVVNKSYAIENIKGASWKLLEDSHECSECGKRGVPLGDYLCQPCRKLVPLVLNVILSIQGKSLSVAQLEKTETHIQFLSEGDIVLEIAREDLSEAAVKELKEFLK